MSSLEADCTKLGGRLLEIHVDAFMQISQLYGQILSNISETTMAASSIGRQSSNLNQSSAPDALFTVPIGSSGIGLQDDSGKSSHFILFVCGVLDHL